MYLDHFRLNQEPFSIAPDPAFLYLSTGHNEALAHLQYGFRHGGFVLITGEVGTGKTTLLRNLVKLTPDELEVAFVLNPRLTVRELLETVCDELSIRYDPVTTQTVKQYIDVLNAHLLKVHAEGRSTVLIIDEAQNLSPAVLEQIRLLTNLETDEKKLLRIILIGQPELDEMLDRTELRQLAQRITARYHLRALSAADTSAYVAHRITTAGGAPEIFPEPARRALFRATKGIPRLINIIADRALLGAYSRGEFQVTPELVRTAAVEISGKPPRWKAERPWLAVGIVVIALLAILWALLSGDEAAPEATSREQAEPQQTTTEPAVAPGTDVASALEPSEQDQLPSASNSQVTSSTIETDEPVLPEPKPVVEEPQGTIEPVGELVFDEIRPPPDVIEPVRIERPPVSTYASNRRSFRRVFEEWGLRYDATAPTVPCDFAPTEGLSCTSRRATWDELERIDLPVVLELWDEESQPFYAALLSKDGSRLVMSLGQEDFEAQPRDLRNLWTGNYTMVWAQPPFYRGFISEGERAASVGELRRQLSDALGRGLEHDDPNEFDPGLTRALEAFQAKHGHTVDGIAGPLTWVKLAQLAGDPMPSLGSAAGSR